ncbi:MAG: helix-turn-helix transcriptional regulator [Actinomycetota bacterium]|nr:helix-turn-helix transcriptional regulator [Actinomycetota bacterium]
MKAYDDPCGTARALGIVGDRWALLVVRELLFGPKRFTDLSRGLPTMSQNVLSQRLRGLEDAGVVRQRTLGPPASIRVYELTERGRALEAVLVAMSQWGSRVPLDPDTTSELSVDALVFALQTTFSAERAGDLAASVQLELGNDRFHAEVVDGRFAVARGQADHPDITLTAEVSVIRELLYGGHALSAELRAGTVALDGGRRLAERFLRCFPRPVFFSAESGR